MPSSTSPFRSTLPHSRSSDEVTRLQWAKGNASRLGFGRATLADWAGQSLWRETFAFLFELLASEEDDDWHADLFDCVFGEKFSRLVGSNSREVSLNLGHLLARLIVNSRSGLTSPKRKEAIESCVRVEFEHPTDWWADASGIFSVLFGDDARLNAETFRQISIHVEKVEPEKRQLDMRGVQVSDLGPSVEPPCARDALSEQDGGFGSWAAVEPCRA